MARRAQQKMPPSTTGVPPIRRVQMEDFARRLYQHMMAKGWSQSDLARAAYGQTTDNRGYKVPRNKDRVSAYIKGVNFPSPKNLAKLAKALDVEVDDLAPEMSAAKRAESVTELSINAAAGHGSKVLLQVNKVVPATLAAEIFGMLATLDDPIIPDE